MAAMMLIEVNVNNTVFLCIARVKTTAALLEEKALRQHLLLPMLVLLMYIAQ